MSKKTAGIAGFGLVGSFMGENLRRHGFDVGFYDIDPSRMQQARKGGYKTIPLEEVAQQDVVFSAVSMPYQEEIVRRLGPLIRPGSMLSSVNSRQRAVTRVAIETVHEGVEVTQIHPIFRPTISFANQKVAVSPIIPTEGGSWTREMEKMLIDESAIVVRTNPDEHDAAMDIIQGLTHTEGMIFIETLRRMGVDLPSMMKFSSPVYEMQIGMAARIVTGRPDLYGPLQIYSERLPEILDVLDQVLRDHRGIVASRETPRFDAMYFALTEYVGRFGATATQATDRKLGNPRGIHIYFYDGDEPQLETTLSRKIGAANYKEWIKTAKVSAGELGALSSHYPIARHAVMKPETAKMEGASVFFIRNHTHPDYPEMNNGMLFTGIVLSESREMARTGTGKFYRVQMNGTFSDPWLNLFDTYSRENLRSLGPLIGYQVV
ncbi:MAG: prephenate dehydrogenase/arogenate dehydrogenase family protein [Candidatus Aenigmarchaeota archaeon]|nr:prephenate dehydrogenase/arogenate dehydrogenase family protein [Candidatus Aenigmarchaeota archaeon]